MNYKCIVLLLCGALFGLASVPVCAQSFLTLYNFNTNSYGADPEATLTVSGSILYGSCIDGGKNGSGVLFAWKMSSNSIEVLHDFSSHTGFINNYYNLDGAFPRAQLVLTNGTLYGTTWSGGSNGWGTIFSLSTNGTGFTNLHIFTGGNDGGGLYNGTLSLSGETLYGVTTSGGVGGQGTLFSIKTNGNDFTVLHSFSAYLGPALTNQDGAFPEPVLPVGNRLYGTADYGGTNGHGTLFSIQTDGSDFTVLHVFNFRDGTATKAPLTLSGQILYGISYGGDYTNGTIYSVGLDGGGFTNLHSFETFEPGDGLILAGTSLYGITGGAVFTLQTNGAGFVTLYNFSALSNSYKNRDGFDVYGDLTRVENTLYGVASAGGTNGWGTLFSLTLPPVPDLAIGQTGTNVILSWPTNALTYTLQTATNLVPPTAWLPVESLPLAADGQNIVTNPADAAARFYRLSR